MKLTVIVIAHFQQNLAKTIRKLIPKKLNRKTKKFKFYQFSWFKGIVRSFNQKN